MSHDLAMLNVCSAARKLTKLGVQDMRFGNQRFTAVLVELCEAVRALDQGELYDGPRQCGDTGSSERLDR